MSASTASHQRDAHSSASNSVLQPGQTLRTLLDELRKNRQNLRLDDAIAIVVPLCLDLKARHDQRERVYVHPSCVVGGPNGLARIDSARALVPTNPLDRACTAPELQQSLEPGNARASVFSIGALLYEAVTGAHVGPGMRRPRDIDPNLPDALETLIAKALVANPGHRPDDLGALASAMHTLAPKKSMVPPSADVSRLDGTADFEVDIRLSMLPTEEMAPTAQIPRSPAAPRITHNGGDPFGGVIEVPTGPRQRLSDPTATLSALKARLESDPRPRYVVNKDHMDHGPFSAVELLQQMASNQFVGTDGLRDELSGQQRPIGEWEEFAPFAVQTALKRDSLAEKKAVAQVERKEKSAGIAKSLIGLIVIAALGAGAALWFFQFRGSRNDDRDVADDPNASDIDIQGGVKGQGRGGGKGGRGRGAGGGGGGFPAGMSYEAAIGANVQTVEMGAKTGPDLTDGQLSAPMKNASFIDGCGAPSSMHVMVKVAIKNGRAVGVSVYPTPPDPRVASCVASAVRNISWPSNSKMDSFTTTY